MTDLLKSIVGALNDPPFLRGYNLISFDSLTSQRLLQELSDVLSVIEAKVPIDIRNEPSEETALRIFNSLRIMKFRPPSDADELAAFRRGVVQGEKEAIYPALAWLLSRVDELQQRAYLAKFLVRVELPPEMLSDPDIEEGRIQYEELMEQFKLVHKESVTMKTEGATAEDIRQDIQSMELEKEQITRRIEKLKRKIDSVPNRDRMLEVAALLRQEQEKEREMAIQKQEQRNALNHADQKIQRLQQSLREVRSQAERLKPEDMIQKLEEENKIHSYMLTEKLPREIAAKRKTVQEMQRVLSLPAMDQGDIEDIKKKMDALTEEIVQLTEQRDSMAGADEDKLSIFRHQAQMVERKKDNSAEKLQEGRAELQRMEQELRDKKMQMRDAEGNEIVTSIQFKNYVNKLRSKTTVYKKKRAEIQDLRAEIGVLTRTEEILKAQLEALRLTLDESGVGFVDEQDGEFGGFGRVQQQQRPKTAKPESKDVQELKAMIRSLDGRLAQQKDLLKPLLQDLKPIRIQYQTISDEYLIKKQQYDTTAASLESGYSRLNQEVHALSESINKAESELFVNESEIRLLNALIERVEQNCEQFTADIQKRIEEAESETKKVQEEEQAGSVDHETLTRQMKLWRDFMGLMECKRRAHLQAANPLGQQEQRFTTPRAGSAVNAQDQIRGRPQSRRLL